MNDNTKQARISRKQYEHCMVLLYSSSEDESRDTVGDRTTPRDGQQTRYFLKCSQPCGFNSCLSPSLPRIRIFRPRPTVPIWRTSTPAIRDGTFFPTAAVNNSS